MKNKLSICIAILLFAAFIKVDAQDSKGFIGISGGYSLPMGNITKSDYMDLSSGFANAGPLFSLEGAYFFNKNIGAGLLVSISNFGVKDQDVLAAGYVEAFAVDEVTLTVGSYKTLNIFPTFYYTLPINKLNIDFRLMVGYSRLSTPKIQIQLEDNSENPIIQNESTGGGLGFGIGAGVRYKLTSHIGIALRVDYINSKPSVDITYQNLNNPTDEFRLLEKYNESIGSINTSFGLTYNF